MVEDDFEVELRRSAHRRRVVGIAIAVLALVALVAVVGRTRFTQRASESGTEPPRVELTGEQRAELAKLNQLARRRIIELDAPWRGAITAIDAGAASAGAPCTVLDHAKRALDGNPQSDWGAWPATHPLRANASSSLGFSTTPFPVWFINPNDPLPDHSPEAAAQLARIDQDSAYGSFADRAEVARSWTLRSADVLIRIDEIVEPRALPHDRFESGRLRSSVWVFDHTTSSVVCAGVVEVSSSPVVDPGTTNLNGDLLVRLLRALPTSLNEVADANTTFTLKDPAGGPASAKMRFGRVLYKDHALWITLTNDVDPGCTSPGAGEDAYFSFLVPPGPGGRFYAGSTFGVPASAGHRGHFGAGLSAEYLAFEIEPFALEAGTRLRGRITSSVGTGGFVATICPDIDASQLRPLPTTAPDHPFAGALDGHAFAMQSALAIVDHRSSTTSISYIELYAAPHVTCANRGKSKAARVRIADIGGASTEAKLAGSPQPARAGLHVGGEPVSFGPESTWVQLDVLSFTGKIAGKAVIESADGRTEAGGVFQATVCE